MRGGWQGLAPGSCCADGELSVLSDRFNRGALSPAPPRPAAPAGGSGVAEGRMGFSPLKRTESFLGIDKLSVLWYIFCRKAATAPARGPPNHLGVRGSGGKPLDRRSGGFFAPPLQNSAWGKITGQIFRKSTGFRAPWAENPASEQSEKSKPPSFPSNWARRFWRQRNHLILNFRAALHPITPANATKPLS